MTVKNAVRYAHRKGVFLVAAGGNSDTEYPHYPATHSGILSVGATDDDDDKAGFSNYGKNAEVSAPGVAILSTLPGDRYGSFSGTSMACPMVAGAAALALSENPRLKPDQLMKALKESGEKVDDRLGPRIDLEKLILKVR